MKIDTRKVEDLLAKDWEIIIEDEDNPTRGKAKPRLKPTVKKLPRAIRGRNQFPAEKLSEAQIAYAIKNPNKRIKGTTKPWRTPEEKS